MKNVLKNKKGMTLIELIVGLVVFTIILTTVSAILAPILGFYSKANELAESSTLADSIASQIIGDLSNATKLSNLDDDIITMTVNNPDDVEYTVDAGGVLLRNGFEVLTESFYKGKGVSFSCEDADGAGGYILTVAIWKENKDDPMISRNYAVKPLALSQYNTP